MMTSAGERFAPIQDRLLAVTFAVLTQVEVWVFEADAGYAIGTRLSASMLMLIASAALLFRRTNPMAAFAVNGLAVTATIAVGFPSDFYQWSNLIATYSVAAHLRSRRAWITLPISIAGVLFYFVRFPSEGGLGIGAFAGSMWAVGWMAGRVYGARIEEINLRAERDLSIQTADARQARLALEEERARMSRELHDIVGHTVNVMVVHAGAGRGLIDSDPEAARRAFATIETTGRSALEELDRLLAVLRQDERVQLAPPPGISALGDLTSRLSDAGLRVGLSVNGDPDHVPTSVALNTYRIIQEALTNTLKHAQTDTAEVDVTIDRTHLNISVEDRGVGARSAVGGRGIIGMRERAAIHNGELAVKDVPDGGTLVSATLRWDMPA